MTLEEVAHVRLSDAFARTFRRVQARKELEQEIELIKPTDMRSGPFVRIPADPNSTSPSTIPNPFPPFDRFDHNFAENYPLTARWDTFINGKGGPYTGPDPFEEDFGIRNSDFDELGEGENTFGLIPFVGLSQVRILPKWMSDMCNRDTSSADATTTEMQLNCDASTDPTCQESKQVCGGSGTPCTKVRVCGDGPDQVPCDESTAVVYSFTCDANTGEITYKGSVGKANPNAAGPPDAAITEAQNACANAHRTLDEQKEANRERIANGTGTGDNAEHVVKAGIQTGQCAMIQEYAVSDCTESSSDCAPYLYFTRITKVPDFYCGT